MPVPAHTALLGAQAAGFSPANLTDLVAWYDASVAGSITGSPTVTQWADLSGNGYHATDLGTGNGPTTGSATQNGLNVLSFDGTEYLATGFSVTEFQTAPGFMFAAVIQNDTPDFPATLMSLAASNARDYLYGFIPWSNGNYLSGVLQMGWGDGAAAYDYYRVDNTDSGWMQGSTFVDEVGNAYGMNVDGVSQSLSNYASANVNDPTTFMDTSQTLRIIISAGSDSTTNVINNIRKGDIAELVLVGGYNATDYASLRSYLVAKWGT